MRQQIFIKRAYDSESPSDGYRVYIDKLWPRVLSHATFHYDYWDKEIAPSTELREWFHSDSANRWKVFEERYKCELISLPALNELKKKIASRSIVTLIYSSHDRANNNAIVVKNLLESGE